MKHSHWMFQVDYFKPLRLFQHSLVTSAPECDSNCWLLPKKNIFVTNLNKFTSKWGFPNMGRSRKSLSGVRSRLFWTLLRTWLTPPTRPPRPLQEGDFVRNSTLRNIKSTHTHYSNNGTTVTQLMCLCAFNPVVTRLNHKHPICAFSVFNWLHVFCICHLGNSENENKQNLMDKW